MAKVFHNLFVELDPHRPVPEICAVIKAIVPYHPGQEAELLRGVMEAVEDRLKELEGVEQHAEQVCGAAAE